jgi:hypothetical protein
MVFLSEMSASNSSSSISMPWVSVVEGKRMEWKWRRKGWSGSGEEKDGVEVEKKR